MYNPQLDTFRTVAETGSFAQAARQLFISTSAVLQQINNLERNLNAILFVRSRNGLKLTPAGEFLLHEVVGLKVWSDITRREVHRLSETSADTLQVILPKMHRNRYFYELWTKYSLLHPERTIEFVESSGSTTKEIGETYQRADIVEFVKTGIDWQENMQFLKIGDVPIALAVPAQHPLAEKLVLQPSDLHGQKLLVHDGSFRDALEEYITPLQEAGTDIRYSSVYNMSVIARCLVDSRIILMPLCSAGIHPSLKTLRCDWDATLPYGFFYSAKAAGGKDSFLAYVKEQLAQGLLDTGW